MTNYPQELAQDTAYQSHTSRLTELWSLPKPAQGLNTYNNNNKNNLSTSAPLPFDHLQYTPRSSTYCLLPYVFTNLKYGSIGNIHQNEKVFLF